MNTRTMTLTLELQVRDLTSEELEACGLEPEDGEGTVEELAAYEIAGLIPNTVAFDEVQDEMFAGSGVLARITGARLVSSEWVKAPSQ